MRYLIALFLPWLSFFTMGKFFSGMICLVFFAISDYHADQRADKILRASRSRINDNQT